MRLGVRGLPNNPAMAFCAAIALIAAAILLAACVNQPAAALPYTISGKVVDGNGPVAAAIVEIQGTPNRTTSASDGTFTLHGEGLGGTQVVTMTAWSEGHFIGWVNLDPQKPTWTAGGAGVSVNLKPLYTVDNNQYTWFTFQGVSGSASCGLCHREYKEWQADAHAKSATNPRFITMYRGTNVQGQEGALTQLASNGKVLPADPSAPNVGPGFLLDNPERAGNCATCHTPLAARTPIQQNCAWSGCHTSVTAEQAANTGANIHGVMPVGLIGIANEGVACEFCHKISAVILDPKTHLPYADMPGILSMQLARPPDGEQLFFGTMVDVSRRVSYLPLEAKSEFCAPCHYGVLGGIVGAGMVTSGTLVYNSYGEWLKSPYSNPATGKTCQDCHMPAANSNISVFLDQGGIARDYITLHDHTMRGVSDPTLMWSAVTLKSAVQHTDAGLTIQVVITNDKTGHNLPTDEPMRSVMLVITAVDANGKSIALKQGPTLPKWTGNYAGQPGTAFAQILRDNWTGEVPTGAIWRPTTIIEDTRLAPFATSNTAYTFELAPGAAAKVQVRLIYRRAFQQLEQQKGWNDADIPMADETIPVQN